MDASQRWWFSAPFMAILFAAGLHAADVVTLKNGMVIEGSAGLIASVGADPLKATGAGDVKLLQILVVDNQLTRTLVPTKQLAKDWGVSPAIAAERIPIPQRVPQAGQVISSVGMPLQYDPPFDEWGRRIYSMKGDRKPVIDVVQGITEITPKWTKVEAIQGANSYLWTMKIATSSIPREQLSRILYKALDRKNPDQRLRIVRLYLQSERYQDARLELEQVVKDFPDLAALKEQVKELHQLGARRILKEAELRRDAGQYRLAVEVLEGFPADGVAGETLLKVRELLDDVKQQQDQGHKVLALLDEHLGALKNERTRNDLKSIVSEIKTELNINNLSRLVDYLRLSDDPKSSAEHKLSLAVSGWLLGSGAAVDNLGISTSLVQVRDLVRQYLLTTRKPERDNLLSKLTSQEGATLEYVSKIIANLKPPLPTEGLVSQPADVGNPALLLDLPAKEPAKPVAPAAPPEPASGCGAPADDNDLLRPASPRVANAVGGAQPAENKEPPPTAGDSKTESPPMPVAASGQQSGVPGLFELTVNSPMSEDPKLTYYVQLPPEYDPYRRYPCIVTLNGATSTPLQQMDWWVRQATRHGYIVIAPRWTREHQRKYEYSAREHAAVLLPLRDAIKRFSIDVDRIFLSGYSMGGDAAWDIGVAHPDVWAGVMPIAATAGKYVTMYRDSNARNVPLYFVCGEKDSNKRELNATDWNQYLTHARYDVMVVEYLGRGHEPFNDEIHNLFAWMNLHRREFLPKEFSMHSLRPWDNYFWWVEADAPNDVNMVLPAEWGDAPKPAKPPRAAQINASLLATNGLSVTVRGFGKTTVWLSPEMVAFNDSLKVTINNKRQTRIQPGIPTLLEDVRTRGDRQHPFWAKVEN